MSQLETDGSLRGPLPSVCGRADSADEPARSIGAGCREPSGREPDGTGQSPGWEPREGGRSIGVGSGGLRRSGEPLRVRLE